MATLPVHYSYGLIVVSVLISILSAYAAFSLADRMRLAATSRNRVLWLVCGSGAMGLGIWSMHYLGMLAVKLPIPVYYYVPTVILSLALAIAASAIALLVVGAEKLGWGKLLAGGVLMGAGIGAMHYVGMAAMRMNAMHHYSPAIVALSVLVAVGMAVMALWIGFSVRSHDANGEGTRVAAGTVMGLGIAAMHYTAMQAVKFEPGAMVFSTEQTVQVSSLVELAVASVAGVILLVAVVSAMIENRRFHKLNEAHQELAASQRELLEAQQQLREANALLSELSIRDGLTGLHNRRHFDAVLGTEWGRARRTKSWIALLMIDVDCFKMLNDHFGHQRGDECLRDIARVLETQPRRSYDLAARYGGEEFTVLLPSANRDGAMKVAEAIRQAIRDLNMENPGSPAGVITVSIGVSCKQPKMGEDAEAMVREADTALYVAKQLGRDRVEVAGNISVEA
ncbi:MAG TPA: diguanylate cyclase [Acidobacteriaceae bacterium]